MQLLHFCFLSFVTNIQINTPRDTQAIFTFHGTFKLQVAQDFSLESQAPHALTSQMFCKREKMFIFSYFCPCLYLHILEIKIFNISFGFNLFRNSVDFMLID